MRLLIFGPPGSGKGTYANLLKKKLNVIPLATGDVFREAVKNKTELGEKVADFLRRGELVPDDLVIEVVKSEIEKMGDSSFILDGYPRTLKQAEALEEMTTIDAIIQLIVPNKIIIERLSNRRICPKCGAIYNLKTLKPKCDEKCDRCGTRLIQREDDRPEVIQNRLERYREQTRPILSYFRGKVPIVRVASRKIDQDPNVVVDRIIQKLRDLGLVG
ncbi:nucleoside monophosphate kinase [Candidatus Bathyarchaeota archaeon]|nr:nucleoside monophosphate kinase [Candidatus Bathyarchaeota archaeon]